MAKPQNPTARSRAYDGLSPRVASMLDDVARAIDRNDLTAAERVLTGASVLAPAHAQTLRLQGLIAHRRNRLAEARDRYRRALDAKPDDATLLGELGELEADSGDIATGLARMRRATELAPSDVAAWIRLGIRLDRQALHDDALAAGRRIVAIDPAERRGLLLIARSLTAQGHIDEAASTYRRLIALGGALAYQAWFSLVDLKTVRLDARETAALQKLIVDPNIGDDARAPLGFAFGKVCEDAGRYADALAAYARANATVRKSLRFDAAAFGVRVDATLRAFSSDIAGAPESLGGEAIFIVGMPRSGTTLIEQILAAHPDIEGASELADLPAVIAAESSRRAMPFPDWVPQADAADWERLGRDYLERTARWRARKPRSIDKLPGNWMLIGAVRAMLPGARIIDCRRDALETCWSCYKQLFAPGLAAFAYDFADLAAQWNDYDRLMRFWIKRYPDHVRLQRYEALLADPRGEIAALLAFCGVPFDEACLEFDKAPRDVRTASSAQVRQPLQRDTARAARYGDLLAPLRDRLIRPDA